MSARVLELIKQKDDMEAELGAIVSELNSGARPVGLTGNLVDREGFPRNDIDVHRIATQRNRYHMLVNDVKQILLDIEHGLHSLHADSREKQQQQQQPQPPTSTPLPQLTQEPAFLRVGEVIFDSPAYQAGLREGDVIFRFGKLRAADFADRQLAGVVAEVVEDRPVRVFLRRRGEADVLADKSCTLLPRKWEGRGLLGCHLFAC